MKELDYQTEKQKVINAWKKKTGKPMHGEDNGSAKLTEEQVLQIRMIWANNKTAKELADKYGVARVTIEKIVNQQAWKHLPSVDDFIRMGEE